MRMITYKHEGNILWAMTPCQEYQEKVEFSILEEAVSLCFDEVLYY